MSTLGKEWSSWTASRGNLTSPGIELKTEEQASLSLCPGGNLSVEPRIWQLQREMASLLELLLPFWSNGKNSRTDVLADAVLTKLDVVAIAKWMMSHSDVEHVKWKKGGYYFNSGDGTVKSQAFGSQESKIKPWMYGKNSFLWQTEEQKKARVFCVLVFSRKMLGVPRAERTEELILST